jgi:hypothetical protein
MESSDCRTTIKFEAGESSAHLGSCLTRERNGEGAVKIRSARSDAPSNAASQNRCFSRTSTGTHHHDANGRRDCRTLFGIKPS